MAGKTEEAGSAKKAEAAAPKKAPTKKQLEKSWF